MTMDKKKAAFFAILITVLIFILSAGIGIWTVLTIRNSKLEAVVDDFGEMTEYEADVYDEDDLEEVNEYVIEEVTEEAKEEVKEEKNNEESMETNNGGFNPDDFSHEYRDYIFDDSDYRELTDSDLENLSSFELRIARNEIYARHGKIFKTRGIQEYFKLLPWYEGISENIGDEKLNDTEKTNIIKIKEFEDAIGNPDDIILAGRYKGYDNDTEISISIYSDTDKYDFGTEVGCFDGKILNPYTGNVDENLEGFVFYQAPGCYSLTDYESFSYEVSFVKDKNGKISLVLMEYLHPMCILECVENYYS